MGGGSAPSGFDCSKYQGGVYAGGGGFSFGIAKATEGVGYVDSAFARHIAAIRAGGLVPGAYCFNRPDLGNRPEDEADFLLQVVGDPRGMLLAPDLEVTFRGALTDYRARFLARIAQRLGGYQAPWYSYWSYIGTHALNTAQTTWCWLAWPDSNGALPGLLVPIRMQQYGLTSVPGLSGQVDANRFFGTIDDLRRLTVGGGEDDMPLPYGFKVGLAHVAIRDLIEQDPTADSMFAFANALTDDGRNYGDLVQQFDDLSNNPDVAPLKPRALLEAIQALQGSLVTLQKSVDEIRSNGPAGPSDDHIAAVAAAAAVAEIEKRLANG